MYSLDLMPTETIKPEISICKNNLGRTTIGVLKDIYGINQKIWIGNINELSFRVPYYFTNFGELVYNADIDKITERRIVKFKKGNYTEYYIITQVSDNMEEDASYKSVQCYSLGLELGDKVIKNYKVVSYNAQQVLNDILSETIWTIDYINAEFLIKYRAFDISSSTVLTSLQQVATTFNAVIIYDTVNRKISLEMFDNIGVNTGAYVSSGNLLQNISVERNSLDYYCTRLKGYGKDGLTFKSVNPTNTEYVENYSSILAGFQRDNSGNVISHAKDISDSLAGAIIDYQNLVASKQTDYANLLTSQTTYQTQLTNANNTLATLKNDLAVIEDNLSVANAEGSSTSALITQKNNKITQINTQQTTVNGIQSSINSVNAQITVLANLLSLTNNFTSDQLREWNPHIVVQEWSNDNFTDPKELLNATKEELLKRQEPKLVANVSMVNLQEILTEFKNWDKFNLGNIATFRLEDIGINVQAKIIEIDFNYEDGQIQFIISNTREILTDQQKFIQNMYKSISTSSTYSNEKYKYDDAFSKSSYIYNDIQGDFDAAKRTILASENESVEISRKGIRVYDLNDPTKMLIIQHGIMALSQNSGNTWSAVIKPDRIVAEQVKGVLGEFVQLYADRIIVNPNNNAKIPDTVITSAGYWNSVESNANGYSSGLNTTLRGDLRLTASLPTSIQLDSNGITAYTTNSNNYARLDHRGLYIQNGAVQISSTDGTTMITSTGINASAVRTGSLTGIEMSIGSGNNIFKATSSGIQLGHALWSSAPFRVDMSGNAYANTMTLASPSISNGSIVGTSINVNNNFTVNSAGYMTATGASISGNITMTGGSITWSNVTAPSYGQVTGTKPPTNADNTYISLPSALGSNYTQIGSTYIYTGTLNANQINAGVITGITLQTNQENNPRIIMTGAGFRGLTSDNLLSGIVFTPSYTDIVDIGIYHRGQRLLEFYDDISRIKIRPGSGSSYMTLGVSGKTVTAEGYWDFSNANTNLTAVFG